MASLFCHYRCACRSRETKTKPRRWGWCQVRNALKKRNESGDYVPVSFKPFEEAYKTLTEKLQPMCMNWVFKTIKGTAYEIP